MLSNPFSLRINSLNVNQFVRADEFDGYQQKCEAESIWDFVTDDVTISLDKSALPALGYDENNYHLMEKLPAELYYFGQRVFGGIVGDAAFNKNDSSLELELWSYGRVAKGISFDLLLNGFSAQGIAEKIVAHTNFWLTNNNFPFTLDNISLDTIDFPFYQSLGRVYTNEYGDQEGTFQDYTIRTFFKGIYTRSGKFYLVFDAGFNSSNWLLYKYDINTRQVDDLPIQKTSLKKYKTGNIEPIFEDVNGFRVPDENNLPEGVVDILRSDIGRLMSVVPDGSGGYLAAAWGLYVSEAPLRVVRYEVTDADVYWLEYKNGKVGDMLRDLAIMTNSRVWVGPDTTVYFQKREGVADLDAVDILSYKSSIVKHDNEFKIPDAYNVLEHVKDDVAEYFNDYLAGKFYRITTTVFKDQIAGTDYPIMLKALPIKPGLSKGEIKAVKYKQHTLEIETEMRVANNA